MKSLLRSVVAAPKQSHYDSRLNMYLDLSYINSQLIVSSGPVTGYLKSFYRYPVSDLLLFLNENHSNHWHIWNFRGEEPGYEDIDVLNRVSHFPFPDHQAPTLDIIVNSVYDIDQFLQTSPQNVAVLHCKAGKGRSGSICCAYIMYDLARMGRSFEVDEIIADFTERRMKQFAGEGISIVSQRRYLGYWYKYLQADETLRNHYKESRQTEPFLDRVRIRNGPIESQVFKMAPFLETYEKVDRETTTVVTKGRDMTLIPIKNASLGLDTRDLRLNINGWCYSWFDIQFETKVENISNGVIKMKWNELDGFKGTRQRGVKLFDQIEIYWRFS
ncbi:protein tyrosine phosphatase [Scheffersomyces stipitis CBS 6054]|uniref:phosphatidylinositol-3,4,5-trisphosphate 3-phosphatase n=1 Tax=Scheffersomyces stipitis (strain ATCC 58785 / CBS 6054 / NBRC 10063 / NRRL Y-11545) TaxID=322104 RepID=A3LPE6_PICST|nr:protein tyrosine phosphatase [Scheffersomyces stipitis CBS 6054]ABN65031.2 protein tyrosine phosphatase [Scheffersomyces stipitis CBS 6054]